MSETTGSFKGWLANGGKKTVGKVAAAGGISLGGLLITLHASPTLLPYVTAAEYQDTTIAVTKVVTKVESMEKSMTRYEERSERMEQNIVRIAEKLGVQTEKAGPVVIEYVPDSNKNGIIRKGDTVWIPVSDSSAIRPR